MRGFVFRLQRALRFSLLRENQKKTQVAAGLQRVLFLEKYILKLEKSLRTALEVSRQAVHELGAEAHRQAIVPALDERKRISKLLMEEREGLKQRQTELARLSQRRRSLESLREKHLADFKLETSRKEQKRIDGFSVQTGFMKHSDRNR